MRTIGYARVSGDEQCLDLQVDALTKAGCHRIFQDDGISAIAAERPGFEAALHALSAGDTLIIWKMDRAFRSCKHALDTLELLEKRRVSFRSITEFIDTKTALGRCMYQIRNAFAEFERALIIERTKAGLAAARRRGVALGRPRLLSEQAIAKARQLLADGHAKTIEALARDLDVSSRTLRRALAENDICKRREASS